MIRSVCLLRSVLKGAYVRPLKQSLYLMQGTRNSHVVSYRTVHVNPKITNVGAEIVSAVMWWWILWHLWHEYEHITGEFPYPSTSAWTNSELGIPSTKE